MHDAESDEHDFRLQPLLPGYIIGQCRRTAASLTPHIIKIKINKLHLSHAVLGAMELMVCVGGPGSGAQNELRTKKTSQGVAA